MVWNTPYIIKFSKLDNYDLDVVGKKAHDLNKLILLNIPIPEGFVITPTFFREFLDKTGISEDLKKAQSMKHPAIEDSFTKLLEPIRKKIMRTHIPQHLTAELRNFYRKLAGVFGESCLNICSSVKENKSIAFYDIKGDANLILKIKTLLAYYLDQPFSVIVQKTVKSKDKKAIITNDAGINDQNLLKLAKKVQNHFYFPKVIEYVIEKNKIFVTQVKPFTGTINKTQNKIQPEKLRKILIKGVCVNPGIVTGVVKLINNQNSVVKNSEIIVIKSLNKSSYDKIKKAKAVVTDTVLQTSIDKLYYKKIIKAPTIIGCENATKLLQNGNIITVNGTAGEIYSGGFI